MNELIKELSEIWGAKHDDVMSKSRKFEAVKVRHCIYYYLNKDKGMNHCQISRALNSKRSNIFFSIKRFGTLISLERDMMDKYNKSKTITDFLE